MSIQLLLDRWVRQIMAFKHCVRFSRNRSSCWYWWKILQIWWHVMITIFCIAFCDLLTWYARRPIHRVYSWPDTRFLMCRSLLMLGVISTPIDYLDIKYVHNARDRYRTPTPLVSFSPSHWAALTSGLGDNETCWRYVMVSPRLGIKNHSVDQL